MSFKKLFVTAFCFSAFCAATASAQLPAGSFGIGADLSRTFSTANILYAVSPAFQLQAGIGIDINNNKTTQISNTFNYETERNNSQIFTSIGGKYFFRTTGLLPYIGVFATYSVIPENTDKSSSNQNINTTFKYTSYGASTVVGAQYFIVPPIALHGQFGLAYTFTKQTNINSQAGVNVYETTSTNNSISFGNTSLGVSFYF